MVGNGPTEEQKPHTEGVAAEGLVAGACSAHSKKAPLGRLFTLVGRAGFEPATN